MDWRTVFGIIYVLGIMLVMAIALKEAINDTAKMSIEYETEKRKRDKHRYCPYCPYRGRKLK